jgi:hypothetical protein
VLGEELLQIRCGEGVVRGLGDDRLTVAGLETLDQPDVSFGRVEGPTGPRFGVQDPDHEVAALAGRGDQPVHPVGDVGVVDRAPVGADPERFLDVDDDQCCLGHASILRSGRSVAVGINRAGTGRIWSARCFCPDFSIVGI